MTLNKRGLQLVVTFEHGTWSWSVQDEDGKPLEDSGQIYLGIETGERALADGQKTFTRWKANA